MAPTQKNRFLFLHPPTGDDSLLLTSFRGHEEVSRLFRFELEMFADDNAIKPPQIVGKPVEFGVKRALPDGTEIERPFHGFVSRFSAGDEEDGRRAYRAEVVPWLWFLTRTSDCRIFQHKTIPQIIEQIFGDLGFTDYDIGEITGHHPQWEYCVQYRETDFNFVSRLMEQEGIYYYFKHEKGKHTMMLADHAGGYYDLPEKEVDYPTDSGSRAMEDHITSWTHDYAYRTGKWTHTDYNFETPSTNLMTDEITTVDLPNNKNYEFYDYPGEYMITGDGQPLSKFRMEEEEVEYDIVHGASKCKTFSPGGMFKVRQHRSPSEKGGQYTITSIHHSAVEPMGYESGAGGGGEDYSNSFTCIPNKVEYRPARLTPKPIVQGAQTAVVTGPPGEEIWPDKYGRVKVQFHWDREGEKDEKTTCWMRTMQNSAGKQWGSMFIPRIGQEVVVDFLEGDPDKPLITGLVYNAEQMPHYDLPGEKTKSYIKTNTSPGGDGHNEIRFEDLKDKEQIYMHAERNMDVRVKNDSMERIIVNRHLIVGNEGDNGKVGNQQEQVYQDKHLRVHRNQIEQIDGNMELMIGHGEADDGGNLDIVIEKTKKELIEADNHLHVKGNHTEMVDGSRHITFGGNKEEAIGGKSLHKVGDEVHINAGSKIILEAGQRISLKVGGNFVDIGPSGVTIVGTLVKINSGGSAGNGKDADPQEPIDAKKAAPAAPTEADNSTTGYKSAPE